MAIIPLSKITLYGTTDQKAEVLDALQDLGCVHLVDLGASDAEGRPVPNVSVDTHQALKFLRACPVRRRSVMDDAEFCLPEVVQNALRNEERQEQLQQERDELLATIADLEPWGDFHLPAEREFGDLQFWFFVIPHYRLRLLESLDATWQEVSRDHRFAYVAVISTAEPQNMPVARKRLDQRPLSKLHRQLEKAEAELDELHWGRVAMTRWIDTIQRSIALADDEAARRRAAQQTLDDSSVFVLHGWTPQRDLDRLRSFAAAHALALTVEPPTENDSPPTLLENPPATAGGQAAVTFYTTPAYNAWDPSTIVFVSFSVFFAMIMADAGYALVLGGLLLLLWRKLGRSEGGSRIRRLALAIVIASIAYGALVGSYFGLPPAASSPLARFHVIDAGDTGLMMRISIVIGVLHIAVANLAVAWHARWSMKMLSSVGWTAALLGGLAFGFGRSGIGPEEPLAVYGGWTLFGGLLTVLLFSSNRPLWSTALTDHAWRLADGLKALVNVTRAFGDVLSYLRLFALGLASAQLAATFNDLTYKASCCVGVGSLLAVLVVVFGHGLNLSLAVMSGVVHGLRLNCIEFFGWGLPEEGYAYQPFCRKAG